MYSPYYLSNAALKIILQFNGLKQNWFIISLGCCGTWEWLHWEILAWRVLWDPRPVATNATLARGGNRAEGRACFQCDSYTWLEGWCWLHIGTDSLHIGLSSVLLEYPHNIEAGFFQQQESKSPGSKMYYVLWPSVGSHMLSFALYSIGHLVQVCVNRGRSLRKGSDTRM